MASDMIEVELILSEPEFGEKRDRLQRLRAQTAYNGIDFVEVVGPAAPGATELWVHFLNREPEVEDTFTELWIAHVVTQKRVSVSFPAEAWGVDDQDRPSLRVLASLPDDPGPYTLTMFSPVLDPYFEQASFSLNADSVSQVDCAASPPVCPPELEDLPPIDYLAKDFGSFRQALLDFSALRYPEWQERSEADFGVMFLEALCALADDLSYTQDRVAAESSLETATQRRSLVRHARLLDYEARPQTSASVLLQFDVTANGAIPSGLLVNGQSPDGPPVPFETGTGLHDPNTQYAARVRWNRGEIKPYLWDRSQACLSAGATEMWIHGHGFDFTSGQVLLIETAGETPGDPPLKQIVHLTASREAQDPLYEDAPVTRISWQLEDALERDRDLHRTVLAGNLVPATQGKRAVETFAVAHPPKGQPQMPLAVWRTGANGTDQYLYPLQNGALAWLASDDMGNLLPEITLVQGVEGRQLQWTGPRWSWVRWLLEAESFGTAFTVDPAQFRAISPRTPGAANVQDYDGDGSDTIRFGDGIFGELPDPGTAFQVTYRAGGGTVGNVASDSITQVGPGVVATPTFDPILIRAVTNPFAATGGADPEPTEQVRRLAPYAFRDKPLRAVLPEDYQAAATALPWVRRAGAQSRWVGSWNAVSLAADAVDGAPLSETRAGGLDDLLDRRRLAGHASSALTPRYVSLVLRILVDAETDAFRSEVQQAIVTALGPAQPAKGITGFFNDGFFTFGTPLDRAALTAAVQSVPGVANVLTIQYRRRDRTMGFLDLPPQLTIGADQIVRVENDPRRPDRGSLSISVEGGK